MMSLKRTALLAATALVALPGSVAAKSLLASVFTDHAVLQRDQPIRVWGETDPNTSVQVELSGQGVAVMSDGQGRWMATLPARQPGKPLTLKVQAGKQSQTVSDLLVGDVWLCSGQSNMEFQVIEGYNAVAEASAVSDTEIRLLKTGRISATAPLSDLPKDVIWKVASPKDAASFSAACYFMGRDLKKKTGVPVGLIDASWGGSGIQFWISTPALTDLKMYNDSYLHQTDFSVPAQYAVWHKGQELWAERNDPNGKIWRKPDFDDSSWGVMPAEGYWEWYVPGMTEFDGTVWLRAEITLTAKQVVQGGQLKLGQIDDYDTAYVNGVEVGASEGWWSSRDYKVDRSLLKEGRNVIAVRVVDSGGMGGAFGPAAEKGLKLNGGEFIPIGKTWRYKVASNIWDTGHPPHWPMAGTKGPASMYNGMISPLAPYTIKGVSWYQGESNVFEAKDYGRLLPAMIADWRRAFQQPDLPFMVVQLASYGAYRSAPGESGWAAVRDVQRRTAAADPSVGLASALDIGDIYEIHPANKQQLGARLALAARKHAYGENDLNASGPAPLSIRRDGSAVVVDFDQPLTVFGSARPAGFELCYSTGCRFVDAAVEGKSVRIEDNSPDVLVKVRYAWADSPIVNLYGANRLPASPFELPVE
jgi:sialate O-acetylesterase